MSYQLVVIKPSGGELEKITMKDHADASKELVTLNTPLAHAKQPLCTRRLHDNDGRYIGTVGSDGKVWSAAGPNTGEPPLYDPANPKTGILTHDTIDIVIPGVGVIGISAGRIGDNGSANYGVVKGDLEFDGRVLEMYADLYFHGEASDPRMSEDRICFADKQTRQSEYVPGALRTRIVEAVIDFLTTEAGRRHVLENLIKDAMYRARSHRKLPEFTKIQMPGLLGEIAKAEKEIERQKETITNAKRRIAQLGISAQYDLSEAEKYEDMASQYEMMLAEATETPSPKT
jgi:hypothetical protein